jgi:SP family general alpha glucoside:H+ symporter-like MFS transporter
MNIVSTCLGFIGMFIGWYLMSFVGRRTMLVTGLGMQTIVTFTLGFMSLASHTKFENGKIISLNPALSWAQGAIVLISHLVFQIFIGTIWYPIVPELFSDSLRVKGISICQFSTSIVGTPFWQLTPYMINASAWNWQGKSGFFFGGVAFLAFLIGYLFVPETFGRTHAEVDKLFAMKVPARKFRTAPVDIFTDNDPIEVVLVDEGRKAVV